MIKHFTAASAALAGLCLPASALADTTQTVTASAETQEFSDGYGSMRTATLEYKLVTPDTTVVVSPRVGERRAVGVSESAVGGGVTVYHDWSDAISTRTSVSLSEDAPVFAQYDVAQDVTLKVADRTTLTLGGRFAQYFGNQDVTFLSAGVRQYFKFGSVAYRLSRVDPEGRDSYLAHLVNIQVKDGTGNGRTSLWLSAGEASISPAQVPDNFSGDDYSAVLQRVQPITDRISLVPTIGYSSYDRPADRVDAISLGLGIALDID
jgi:YaiO family outer membrane protein